MIEVARFLQRFEADLARSRLVDSGIDAHVMADNEGGMAPHLSYATGVRLMVRSEDRETALAILATPVVQLVDSADDAHEDEQRSHPMDVDLRRRAKAALGAAVLGMLIVPVIANLWSVKLLWGLGSLGSLPAAARTMALGAWVINGLVCALVAGLIALTTRG